MALLEPLPIRDRSTQQLSDFLAMGHYLTANPLAPIVIRLDTNDCSI